MKNAGMTGLVMGVALMVAAPAGHALQPEPQLMLEDENILPAAQAGALAADRSGSPDIDQRRGSARGAMLLLPYIRLSEQQEDKLFELRHAHEAAVRAQLKELRGARAELRTLALADSYDEARARQVAARAAQASSEIDLLHARLQHAAFTLLTPEQRRRIDECKPYGAGAPPSECVALR